jgi:hypothetical protein
VWEEAEESRGKYKEKERERELPPKYSNCSLVRLKLGLIKNNRFMR